MTSINGGFPNRIQEKAYATTLYNMLCLLQYKLAKQYSNEIFDEGSFRKHFVKLYQKLCTLDSTKYCPPRFSLALKDLANHFPLSSIEENNEKLSLTSTISSVFSNRLKNNMTQNSEINSDSEPLPNLPRNIKNENRKNYSTKTRSPRVYEIQRMKNNYYTNKIKSRPVFSQQNHIKNYSRNSSMNNENKTSPINRKPMPRVHAKYLSNILQTKSPIRSKSVSRGYQPIQKDIFVTADEIIRQTKERTVKIRIKSGNLSDLEPIKSRKNSETYDENQSSFIGRNKLLNKHRDYINSLIDRQQKNEMIYKKWKTNRRPGFSNNMTPTPKRSERININYNNSRKFY